MKPLLVSLALFGAAWLVHVAWWRSRPPARHLRALVWLFALLPPLAAVAVLPFLPQFSLSATQLPAALALYAGAATSYLIIYTGVEQTSPTLVIVRALARAQGSGCSEQELAAVMTDDVLLRPRMQALMLDGILAPRGDGWVLTPRGHRAARIAGLVSRLFDIKEVG